MKKSDKISYRQKSKNELIKLLADLNKKLVESRAKYQLGGLKDSSVFRKTRYQIAFIKSLLSSQNDQK